MEGGQHGRDLLQTVPVLAAGGQSGQQLNVLEVVETVKDGAQQQLGQVELDCFSEALARGLEFVSHLWLSQQTLKSAPATSY